VFELRFLPEKELLMLFIGVTILSILMLLFIGYLLRRTKLILLIFIIVCSFLLRSFVVQAYKIPAGSMMPTLNIGDHILTNKYIYRTSTPKRGDLIIFPFPKDPRKDYIKRVIGLPGEVFELKNKIAYINEKKLKDPHAYFVSNEVFQISDNPRDNMKPVMIPEGKVFVMGDNRDQSLDSRFFGFVDIKTVKAKAEIIYWSWDKNHEVVRWDRIGKFIK
jgi:signal peptidase I